MRFHLITRAAGKGKEPLKIPALFQAACEQLGVEYVEHVAEHMNLSQIPTLGPEDLLYRSATDGGSILVARLLTNAQCTSFYSDWTQIFKDRVCSFFLHEKMGLPVIPSAPYFPDTEADLVEVNFPNDFSTTQKVTGIDIAQEMVQYLMTKAKNV